jgi:hypothetical protein
MLIVNRQNLAMVAVSFAAVIAVQALPPMVDPSPVQEPVSVVPTLAADTGAGNTPARGKNAVWQEDELPRYLTLWVDRYGADLQRAKGRIQGHKHCWLAVADTSRVACPDGFRAES